MDIYLPIAGVSVNALVIVGLGGLVGFLSGMFGVGGGFLTTPLLIFYGIPPVVAVASSATQITGASVSGLMAYIRRGAVDFRMGCVLVAGGVVGSLLGIGLFRLLQMIGQIDTAIGIAYVVLLGGIGVMMLNESVRSLWANRDGDAPRRIRRHHRLVAALPLRWRFYRSGLYISPIAPFMLGALVGALNVLLGVGGGFIMIPAAIYLLGMSATAVVGTSLFQMLFVTAATTMIHATTTHAVDIVLAALLLVGGVVGAQFGARSAVRLKPEMLRFLLALIVLGVAARMALGLGWRPDEIYTVQPG